MAQYYFSSSDIDIVSVHTTIITTLYLPLKSKSFNAIKTNVSLEIYYENLAKGPKLIYTILPKVFTHPSKSLNLGFPITSMDTCVKPRHAECFYIH